MRVGDKIQCWTEKEMIRREYELVIQGIWTERAKDKPLCLVVTRIREDKEDEQRR